MFRGGDYVDDPKFHDGSYSVKNTLDITVRFLHKLISNRILQEHSQEINTTLRPQEITWVYLI
jgi:hypothetical protein